MGRAEITIYGAGAFGLSCGYEAAKRGAKVRVIDPNGVGAGSSGGVVGALAPHTPERWNAKKEFQFQSLIMAREHWPDVEATGGVSSGYGNLGRVQAIKDDRQLQLARERVEQAKTLWKGKATWEVVTQGETGYWAPISPTGYLVYDTLSARLNPWRACQSLAAAITALGGEVVTEGGEEGAVIHASGWWGLKELSIAMGKEVGNGVKGQAILLDLALPEAPQLYGESLHVIPHSDGTTAIGSTSEREFESPDTTDAQAEDLLERACAAVPMLRGARELRRWAGVRPRAKSRAPMLGPWPGRDGHFIANGGFKIGYGMAPLAAKVLVDLILEGKDEIPEDFRVEASL
ncbi:NAD(P)/FAD-dependent oxidoreductase [Celeribacter litoreus]|uniref:NAD(P)/FAD-dependent oxidoreductase n=1 Tax=Celeribacter litoreus TaxID=2876714 RepID=UPI001CCA60D9|nr:FAD-dependent oxidoreductase [Celeribacter litoreus]MCA0042317.1 FAD-binding oxidoreductase [Celeribacter litoreus]